MAAIGRIENLKAMLEPAVNAAGMSLWGVEYLSQGKHSILRIYIDSDHGVSVDNCEAVSHQVSAVLDVEDPFPGEYHLEVSSPGMDRPLFDVVQFQQFVGAEVKVRLKVAVDGKRRFSGKIVEMQEASCVFEVEGQRLVVPVAQIDKANVVPQFD